MAVGATGNQTLALMRRRSTWSVTPTPIPPYFVNSHLAAVSCLTPDKCWAVGQASLGTEVNTLTEAWNGTSWSIVPSPSPGAQNDDLEAISCTTGTSCMAVGAYYDGTAYQTLSEYWNGSTWSVVPSPNPGGASQINSLQGVSCTSTSSCMAVGFYSNGTIELTLGLKWNGTSWTELPTANPDSNGQQLIGVSCPGTDLCLAAGLQWTMLGADPLAFGERWNGTAWTVTPMPNPAGTSISTVGSVSCGNPKRCTAAGYAYIGGIQQTLVEHWNGKQWSIVPTPNRAGENNGLSGLSCPGRSWPNTCTAVGESFYPQRTLVLSR